MANTVTNPGARLAGLIADLGHKLKASKISEEELMLFLKRQNPFLAPTIAATFVTANYFVDRPGLSVARCFTTWVTKAYREALVPRGLDGLGSFCLTEASSDHEVVVSPEMRGLENVRRYASTPDQIANLIDLQPEGVVGRLLINGYVNLFYVVGKSGKLFVVGVIWVAEWREWHIDTWKFGEADRWTAGFRVFRNTQV